MYKFIKQAEMKKVLLLLITGLLFPGISNSQSWAPQGSEWYYDFQSFNFVGYVKISNTGDTVINSINCTILSKEQIIMDFLNGQVDTVQLGSEYMYSDEDKVYIYRQQTFFTLYDFSANTGDYWEIPALLDGVCDSTGKIIVDSIETTVINNETLRVLYCSAYDGSHWTLGHKIVEKIGCIDSYMLPEGTSNCGVADVIEAGALRCYSDDSFGLYSTGIAEPCDFIEGINNFQKNDLIDIFPNPSNGNFTIESDLLNKSKFRIEIYDITGNLFFNEVLYSKHFKLDLKDGLYFMKIIDGENVYLKKLIIEN